MEISPAESFLSAPSETYSSLFTGEVPTSPSPSINPAEIMTPVSTLPTEALSPCVAGTPAPEEDPEKPPKEAKKKRKSWGQTLPEPKTNLPPRKRAKTEDEKEQRRVERVLRNRRAAQSSRERKRAEADQLQKHNDELREKLRVAELQNQELRQQLKKLQQPHGQVPRSDNQIPRCGSRVPQPAAHSALNSTLAVSPLDGTTQMNQPIPVQTLTMANVSPSRELEIPDAQPSADDQPNPNIVQPPATAASDMTQHSAAMLCDLQCQSEPASDKNAHAWTYLIYLACILQNVILSAWRRPLTQISLSLMSASPLPPTPPILTTILLLVTRVTLSTTPSKCRSTCTSRRSTATLRSLGWSSPPSVTTSGTSARATNLRVNFLRKILSSSPTLARPLRDATLAALRLMSGENHDPAVNSPALVPKSNPVDDELTKLLKQVSLPRREILLTLAFITDIETKRMSSRRRSASITGRAELKHGRPGMTGPMALQDTAAA